MAVPTFRFDDPPLPADGPTPLARLLDAERTRVARLTARGVGMPIAGTLYWLGVAALLSALPLRTALLWSYVATGAVFPVGVVLNRWLGGDLFARSDRLTSLALLMNALQLFCWPMIVVVGSVAPAWTPFAMATLFGAHFLGYAWLYRSRAYAVLAVGVTVVCTGAVLVARDPLPTMIPLLTAAVYALASSLLLVEVRAAR